MNVEIRDLPAPTGDVEARDAHIVRLARLIAVFVAVVYVVIGLISANSEFLLRAIGPALISGITSWQLRAGRPRAATLLMISVVFIVVQVRFIRMPGIERAALIGILMIGAAASVLIRRRRLLFLAGFPALLLFSQVWWATGTTLGAALVDGVPAVVGFWFISWLILWARQNQETEEARYELLFARAPVSILEEDYRGVGDWLDHLRRHGVRDLRGYLADHPEEIVTAATKIIVKDANQATLDLLEVDNKDQLLGPLPADSITKDTLRSFEEQFVAIWENRDHLDTALRGQTMRGNEIDGLLRWVVPREKDRLDLGNVVIAMVDISDLRHAERRLQALVRSKDQFIASVSHELRTPLTAIVGLTDEMRNHHTSFSASEKQEFLNLIANQAADVTNIVEDLLVAARADIGTVTIASKEVDIAGAVTSAAETFGNRSHPEIEIPANSNLRAMADEARVRQILRNLLSNAHRYGGGRVTVRAGQDKNEVWIEVGDNGPGVDVAERDRIFEPYATAHSVAGVTAAVGLGLTVSRQLARLMSGDLTYRHENGESTFRLSLPASMAGRTRLTTSLTAASTSRDNPAPNE